MEQSLRYEQLLSIFYQVTNSITSSINNVSIRKAYQENSAPFQELQSPTIYYWIGFTDTPADRQINEIYIGEKRDEQLQRKYWHMRQISVNWTIYGDRTATDIIYDIRTKLYSYEVKRLLDKHGIKLITDTPEINVIPENINNRWWIRGDLSAQYYISNVMYEDINTIELINAGLVPNPTQKEEIEGVENGTITRPEHSSTLCRDIELDIEELRKIAEQQKGGKN